MTDMEDKKFHTLHQVADILGCHYMTVRNEIKAGNIKAIKVGRHYRIEDTELARYTKVK